MAYESAMTALADPMRRRIVEALARGPSPVSALARTLPISQPAVSQHLKVLREARLVRAEPRGASNLYRLDQAGFRDLLEWLDGLWATALDAGAGTSSGTP